MSHNNSNLVICGDFNYLDIYWISDAIPASSKSRNFIHFLNNSNLEQLITEHTRFRLNQSPSTLNLLLTNSSQLLTEHEILLPIGNSDYALIGTSIQTVHKSNTVLKFKNVINYSNLDQELASIDWEQALDNRSIDSQWTIFFSIIQNYIKSSVESEETLDQKLHVTNVKAKK